MYLSIKVSFLFKVIVTEVVDGVTFWAQNVDTGNLLFGKSQILLVMFLPTVQRLYAIKCYIRNSMKLILLHSHL